MSERRTAEIKFRCTPSFKSGAQAAADAAGQSLTEYLEAAVWAQQNSALEPASFANALEQGARTYMYTGDGWKPFATPDATEPTLHPESEQALALEATVPALTGTPTEPEACGCRPWEFCRHKAEA